MREQLTALAEELRIESRHWWPCAALATKLAAILAEGDGEVERLRAENALLKAALDPNDIDWYERLVGPPLDPAVVAELAERAEALVADEHDEDMAVSLGHKVAEHWPAILTALRQAAGPVTMTEDAARLRLLCAEVYQVVGALADRHPDCSASIAQVLDNLSAAAEGRPLPHDGLLPFVVPAPTVTDAMVEAALAAWAAGGHWRGAFEAGLQAQRGE